MLGSPSITCNFAIIHNLCSIVYAADHPNELHLSLIPTLKQELNETFEFTRLLTRWGLWAGSEGGAVKTSFVFFSSHVPTC